MLTKNFKYLVFFTIFSFLFSPVQTQEIDVDELLERLDRIEKNISDIQKGRFDEIEKSLSSGYISRIESKLGDVETKIRTNYGFVEESDNKINNLKDKLNLIDKDFQSRIEKIEKEIKILSKIQRDKRKTSINEKEMKVPKVSNLCGIKKKDNLDNSKIELTENEIKKKI